MLPRGARTLIAVVALRHPMLTPNMKTTARLLITLVICSALRSQAARLQPALLLQPGPGVENGCVPTQVHLALGKDASEMHVSWKTSAANCLSELIYKKTVGSSNPPLHADGAGVSNAFGYSFLLSERDMCSEPAADNKFMLYLHRAKMTGLEPSTEYLYQVAGSRTTMRFRTAPEPKPEHEFTFLAFGDMGDAVHEDAKSPGARHTLLRLEQEIDSYRHPTDLILHVGDISYANGDPDIWDSFMDGIEPVAARVPYMVAIGNHEYGYSKDGSAMIDPSGASGPYQPDWGNFGADSQGECGVMTARRFHMPQHSAYESRTGDNAGDADGNGNRIRPNAPFWYSFDYGNVHFTVISTEHSLEKHSRQYAWLKADMAAVDRCTTPWLVVLLHRPLYVVYPHGSNREVGEHLRDSIEDLLQKYRVDLTVSGHVHTYFRTCPVYDESCIYDNQGSSVTTNPNTAINNTGSSSIVKESHRVPLSTSSNKLGCDANGCRHGIVHFVIGSAGHELSDVDRDQENWVSATVQRWGYGRFTVKGSDRLLVEYVGSESGDVLDWVEVKATAARDAMCDDR